MNNDQFHIDPALLARFFSEETTPEENQTIMTWKEASPENAKEFEELRNVWSLLGKINPDQKIDLDKEWEHHQKLIPFKKSSESKSISLKIIWTIAASILLIIGFSYAGWTYFNHKAIESPIAENRHLVLPDGSEVTLNAGSKLSYLKSGWDKMRQVTLEGEGFFEVTKNKHLPFIIHLGKADIKVLGTTFNVRAYQKSENYEVTVAEGSVSVYDHEKTEKNVLLQAGEKALFKKASGELEKLANDDKNFDAWKTRILVFNNDSLPRIIEVLNNVYHQKMTLQDNELSKCTISTTFDHKDLNTILNVLKSTLDVTMEEKKGVIVIKGKGC